MTHRGKKRGKPVTMAGFPTCSMVKKCTNTAISMALYLEKDWKFAVDVGWQELQVVNDFEVVEGR